MSKEKDKILEWIDDNVNIYALDSNNDVLDVLIKFNKEFQQSKIEALTKENEGFNIHITDLKWLVEHHATNEEIIERIKSIKN